MCGLPLVHPLLGTWPETQARALTGDGTRDPSVHRPFGSQAGTQSTEPHQPGHFIQSLKSPAATQKLHKTENNRQRALRAGSPARSGHMLDHC